MAPRVTSLAATKKVAYRSQRDNQLLNELYELLEHDKDSNNVVLLELILEQWQNLGDRDMAIGVAQEIIKRDAKHAAAQSYLLSVKNPPRANNQSFSRKGVLTSIFPLRKAVPASYSVQTNSAQSATGNNTDGPSKALPKATTLASNKKERKPILSGNPPSTEKERKEMERLLKSSLQELQLSVTDFDTELQALKTMNLVDNTDIIEDVKSIMDGRLSEVVMPPGPRPVRQLVRDLRGSRAECQTIVTNDFTEVAQWALERKEAPKSEIDVVRERLVRRQLLLDSMLPKTLEGLGHSAMMQVEHLLVHYGKSYANTETMLGDKVEDISAANLIVTSDNYAWDMAELADALAANSGIMRNPLTRDMFSESDVKQILNHPLGKRLRLMAMEQRDLKNGVRMDTITQIAKLGRQMLEDQSAHATPTITAIDEFMLYFSTLPRGEQRTLKSLKLPAKDSHTGHAYDSTIMEAVDDAKANRICFHKAGDFLKQAAVYLSNIS